MGKQSAPPPPDYAPIAQANAESAKLQYQLGNDQLQWGKDQFNKVWPYAQQYLQQQSETSKAATETAKKQQDFYDTNYKPIEAKFANEAQDYNSPDRANQNAGAAMADVASSFDQNRAAALSNLESYGIDASQTRFGALDLGTRVAQAAATAGAGTQSRLNTQGTGLAMQGEAINIGRGYSNSVAQSYGTATQAGSAGLGGANSTNATGSGMTGSPTSYMSLGNQSRQNQVGALNTGYNNEMAGSQFEAQQGQAFSQGLGSLAGTALMAAAIW